MDSYLFMMILLTAHQAYCAPSASLLTSNTTVQKDTVIVRVPENGWTFFTSPNFPALYGNNLNVEYTIIGPEGNYLYFYEDVMDTEPVYDIITFSEIGAVHGETYIGTFDAASASFGVHSTSNVVRAVFQTDDSVAATGFRIRVFGYPKSSLQSV